jgi:hypothetical protein
MEFKPIATNAKHLDSEDELVKFESTDLPTPGSGFDRFFRAITAGQEVSPEQFDTDVMRVYGR